MGLWDGHEVPGPTGGPEGRLNGENCPLFTRTHGVPRDYRKSRGGHDEYRRMVHPHH